MLILRRELGSKLDTVNLDAVWTAVTVSGWPVNPSKPSRRKSGCYRLKHGASPTPDHSMAGAFCSRKIGVSHRGTPRGIGFSISFQKPQSCETFRPS